MSNKHHDVGFDPTQVDEDTIALDDEDIRLKDGTRLTDDVVDELVDDVRAQVEEKKAGRPSLSGGSTKSPQIAVRVSEQLYGRLFRHAALEDRRMSDLVREALEEYADRVDA